MNIAKTHIPAILPIWQPVGFSTHLIAKQVSEKLGVKTSHTGTLDPLAQGVIIVLTGEDSLKKYEYAAWLKSYEFDVVFGLATDTFDPMGMLTTTDLTQKPSTKELKKTLGDLVGEYSQQVPPYSTIKVKGKSMHQHARAGKLSEVSLPVRSGEIRKISLVKTYDLSIDDFVADTVFRISKVVGDFRQAQIVKQWQRMANQNKTANLYCARVAVELTKGLYVRSLTVDIANRLNSVALCTNIIRTKNGKFSQKNSLPLAEVLDTPK